MTNPATVLQLGRWQHASLHFRHLVAHAHSERLQQVVRVEVGASHQVVDLALAVRSRARGGLDHGRRLHVGELLHAALTGHDVADLERQVRVLLLLSHLQARQVWVPETNAA